MQREIEYHKFGNRIKAQAIIGIVEFILIVLSEFVFNILPKLGIYFHYDVIIAWMSLSVFVIIVIDLVFAFLVLFSIKILKTEAQDIHYSQFFSKFLVAMILKIIYVVYIIAVPAILGALLDWEQYILAISISEFLQIMLLFVSNLLLMNAWSCFQRFAKLRQLSLPFIQDLNLIRVGYIFTTIGSIISFLSSFFMFLAYNEFPLGYYLTIFLYWGFFIASIFFSFISPVILIVGRFRLAKSIRHIRFSTSVEPTIGDPDDYKTSLVSYERKICPNCGASTSLDAIFCPNCGNSFE